MRKVSGPNMAANNFKVFNESKTNVMNDTDYGIHIQRKDGVSSGLAVSALHNKLYRQTSIAAKAVADFIASQELDATDNDSVLFSTNLLKALEKVTKVPLDGHRTKEVLDHPDSSVTTPKIADKNVTTEKIADKNVTTPKIADKNVTTEKIADNSVTTPKIADGSVTTPKILDKSVTLEKLADYVVGIILKKSDIQVITGEVANGGTIPLPNGFLESECKWFAGIKHSNVNEWRIDPEEGYRSNLLAPMCTLNGRIVTVGTQVAGLDGGSYTQDGGVNFGGSWARAFMPGTAWYICIGIHR